ncbi:oxidoreductase [Citrobacter portucalensis]|uniref:oxidoreductase n=1 Tax=Citrobacter portucalensis TaxID=1639133 RepID=UPI00397865B0
MTVKPCGRPSAALIIVAGNYTREKAEKLLASGIVDLVAFGRPFIANPDFPRRLNENQPLAAMGNPATLSGGSEVGYTDYAPLPVIP